MLTDYMLIERVGNVTKGHVKGTRYKVYEFDGKRRELVFMGEAIAPGYGRNDEECARHWVYKYDKAA